MEFFFSVDMSEEDNGYELVNKMTESNEDLPVNASPVKESGDVEEGENTVKSSLFGATEDLIKIDPSRKG